MGLGTKKLRKVTAQLTKHCSTDEINLILISIYSTVTVLLISTELKALEHFVNDVWHRSLYTDTVSFPPSINHPCRQAHREHVGCLQWLACHAD